MKKTSRIFFALIFIVMVVFLSFYYKKDITSDTLVDVYSSEWNKTNGKLILSKNNIEIFSFSILEKPSKVLVSPLLGTIAITTFAESSESSPQNLYVYLDKDIKKVYAGKRFDVGKNIEKLQDLPEKIVLEQFSPSNRFLLFSVNRWDSTESFVYNVDSFGGVKLVRKSTSPFGMINWKQDEECFLNINVPGMYGPEISLGKFNGDFSLSYSSFKPNLVATGSKVVNNFDIDKVSVYWGNGCSGLVYLEEDVKFDKKNNNPAGDYFVFGLKEGIVRSNVPDSFDGYQKGISLEPIILIPKYVD